MSTKKKRMTCTTANDVKSICAPLFYSNPISFFSYGVIYKKGSSCYLGSNPEWMEYMLDLQFLRKYPDKYKTPAGSCYLAENVVPERFNIAQEILNINSGMCLTKEFEDCYESIGFGTPLPISTACEFYLNNRDLLENALLLFKDKAAGLIKEAIEPQNLMKTNSHKTIIPNDEVITKYNIMDNIAVTRYFFDSGNANSKLSARETECLIYLLRGRTTKEIAKEFNISG